MSRTEDDEPQEGDWVTEDGGTFYEVGAPRRVPVLKISCDLTEAQMWKAIEAEMKRQGGGQVWMQSDHGNMHLMTKPKRRRAAPGVNLKKAAELVRAAEQRYGDHGPLISGGLRSHWPDPVKNAIRDALHGRPKVRKRR